ncbi:MAG: hypothetical protein LBO21_02135 [Synergistaceae bacterium]|jgi:hypothetical protein|nr:hypothetical protein [Synergistaceae bacterium]
MKILLDNAELHLDEDVIEDGREAIYEEVRRETAASGRVIVDIIVDGESVGDENTFMSLSGGSEFRFITRPIRGLIQESLREGQRYFIALKNGLESIAALLEESRDHEAQARFSQAIDGIRWLTGTFSKSCMLLGVPERSLKTGNFERDFKDLNRALSDIERAMEGGKTMNQAYIIRDRLLPSIEVFSNYWKEVSSFLEMPLQ